MSEEEKIAADEAATAAAEQKKADEEAAKAADPEAIPSNPVEAELNKVKKVPKSEAEKAAFSLKKNAERLQELGGNPADVLGLKNKEEAESDDEDDDAPLTRGEFKKFQAQAGTKNAMQMADEIEDPHERELAKHYLENTIKPSGNPADDLKAARAIVNSVKNEQIAEESGRKKITPAAGSGSGAPAKETPAIVLDAMEIPFTQPPFNMTPAQIVAARPKK